MDVLYLLVPMSVVAMLGILAVFAWALHGGQFDEIEAVGAQILASSDDTPPHPTLDADQAAAPVGREEYVSPETHRNRSSL